MFGSAYFGETYFGQSLFASTAVATYIVLEEDGTSHYVLEEGGGFLLTEESTGGQTLTPPGFAYSNVVGPVTTVSVQQHGEAVGYVPIY